MNLMARRSKKNSHSGPQREIGKLIAAVFLLLLTLSAAGWGIHLWATAPSPIQRDRVTLCLAAAPKDIIVIVFDTTDGLPEPAKVEAVKLLTDMIEQSPENALLEVRVIDPAQRAGRVVLAICNPGDGRGLSEFTGNPELARRRWRERFREPLVHGLENSLQGLESKSSPLLATFQGIALERFTGASGVSANKKLAIVSDMIEYVPAEYTQYPPADLRYDRFKASPYYKKVRTDLQRAEVDIFCIDRALKGLNTGTHMQFWIEWISDNNGKFGKATKLQGAGKSTKLQGAGKS
jgi:hypothetical protein